MSRKTLACCFALALVGALAAGCDDGGESCVPHHHTVCVEEVTYYANSCGEQEDQIEVCRCGCDDDGAACEAPCPCIPDCAGRECGDDGCEGSCGTCDVAGEVCNETTGDCFVCTPTCGVGQECGLDPTCSTSCGTCTAPETCQPDNTCACVADCDGKECGADGCGGVCGTCTAPEACDATFQCSCTPDCAGKECGPDGCGDTCGTCDVAGEVCNETTGDCFECTPTCGVGQECGLDSTCSTSCGTCTAPETCQPDNTCACVPDCGARECGPDPQGCGTTCGTEPCAAPETCNETTGMCECVPDCTGRECGPDPVCGQDCAPGCTAPETCDAGGQCVCVPECGARECGLDPVCAESCGTCDVVGEVCNETTGDCFECTPDCTDRECGLEPICNSSCGTCTLPETCDATGHCDCVPDCEGKQCGPDGCGGFCAPGCTAPATCNETTGQCETCSPQCAGKECGPDGCGDTCEPGCGVDEVCDGTGQCVGGGTCPTAPVTIMQIQNPNDPNHVGLQCEVTVEGAVATSQVFTASGETYFFIEDPAGGQWSGIIVWAQELTLPPELVRGAQVTVTGVYDEFYDNSQIEATAVTVTGSASLPAAEAVTPVQVNDTGALAEAYESVLVIVQNATTTQTPYPGTDGLDHGEFLVAALGQESDELITGWQFRYPFSCPATGPAPQTPCPTDQRLVGQRFDSITGIMYYSWNHFRIQPRDDADIVLHVDPNDVDGDGVINAEDNCPDDYNPGQEHSDADTFGDACDNCPLVDNEGQEDADGDGVGDACEQVVSGTHLLISEVCVTPNGAEFVEIHNPTDAAIALEQYYLWDATYYDTTAPIEHRYYWMIAALTAFGTDNDFLARFPDGASIAAGETIVITANGQAEFTAAYPSADPPDYSIRGTVSGATQLMVPAFAGSVGTNQAMITNNRETMVLFRWDGASDLVQDVDYLIWGTAADLQDIATDKTDVVVGASTYQDDTPIASQDPATAAGGGTPSMRRVDFDEGTEVETNGNGLGGHNETSENLNDTFDVGAPTPGTI